MKILIVDDDPVSLAMFAHALRDRYTVLTARNGFDAIELATEEAPDLVLLDVMMPELDGLQVCRLLRATPSTADIRVMFVTAVDSPQGEQLGLELGAVDYITKPVNLTLAKLRIHNQLELKRQGDRIEAQNRELLTQKAALETTLGRIKHLEGILAICMHCRKVRTEDNVWQLLEQYISEHTDALFSHGICPECLREHWSL